MIDKEYLVELLKLLSALESWSFAEKHHLPDYLLERLDSHINRITEEVIK